MLKEDENNYLFRDQHNTWIVDDGLWLQRGRIATMFHVPSGTVGAWQTRDQLPKPYVFAGVRLYRHMDLLSWGLETGRLNREETEVITVTPLETGVGLTHLVKVAYLENKRTQRYAGWALCGRHVLGIYPASADMTCFECEKRQERYNVGSPQL